MVLIFFVFLVLPGVQGLEDDFVKMVCDRIGDGSR